MALIKFHALLAVFILPVAIMFFTTGAFYIWEIKGNYEITTQKIYLEKPLQEQILYLVNLVNRQLSKQKLSLPTGKAKIKKIGQSFQLEWSGSDKDIILRSTTDPLIAQLQIKNTSLHRYFVQLHKAKGGILFKIYATILAVALLFLFISGFIMAWQIPRLRKMLLASTALGFISFITVTLNS